MTPASKGTPAKRVPGSRPATAQKSASGNKTSPKPVAAQKRSAQKKAVSVKKAAPTSTSKKAAPAAKKAAASSRKATPAGGAAAKKAPASSKKTAPASKSAAAVKKAPPSKKAPAAVGAATKKTAASAKGAATATSAKKATGPATRKAEAPAKTVFTPKPKPPAPVRPKTGPYAKDAKFLDEVKELLLAERAIYQEQATSLRAEADSLALEREPGDVQFDEESGEGGTVTVDRERNLALSGQATLAVEEIDDALARIVDKTYGYCERCYQPIPKPRLRALPYARLCVACKSGGLSRR
jgi:RNA polymerase-binding transcription factor DksA